MSTAIYKHTINTFELIHLLALDYQSDFELLKRMLFSNLNVITRNANTGDQFTLTYQTTDNGMYLEEQLTTRFDSNVISIVRSGVDQFQVTSTRPWQSPPVIFTRIYDNSPFVEVAVWKKAILLLTLREMELTCQFNNIDSPGRPTWAKLTVVHLHTGLVFELGDAVLKNTDLYNYLARNLPDGRLVLNSDTSPISMNVSKARAKLWFERSSEWPQTLTDFSNCKAWMPPKETDNG